ncbi:MAG TPA: pyridoxamine 5'-phosphate oxidase family protein [Nitrolancea sp.]
MSGVGPTTTLQPRFSSEGATSTAWIDAREFLDSARIYWLATVRPDGRPHVTPLFSVLVDGALYFSTGPGERKAKNLAANSHCVILTGCNQVDGLDVVVEGEAVRVIDEHRLQHIAAHYASKYNWHYRVRDGAFSGPGGEALVFEVQPTTAFGFGKGERFSQTRWRFEG